MPCEELDVCDVPLIVLTRSLPTTALHESVEPLDVSLIVRRRLPAADTCPETEQPVFALNTVLVFLLFLLFFTVSSLLLWA